jgi:threonine dehydratase
LASPSARGDVAAARRLLAAALGESPALLPTPLRPARSLSRAGDVYLKIETGLPTGSFKIRGALYSLSVNAERQPIREVVAASTGNHGAAVAYAGRLLGIRATIFLPSNPNAVKAARIRALDARIVETGDDLAAAIDAARAYCHGHDAFFLHDAADPDVPIGAATIAAEILEQLPAVDTICVPMGDTALVRGVAAAAKALKPEVTVVGAVAGRAPAYALAWQSGEAIETSSAETIADGLAVRRTLAPNVAAIRALVDEIVMVSDEEMVDAIDWLETREGVEAEPAGSIRQTGPFT